MTTTTKIPKTMPTLRIKASRTHRDRRSARRPRYLDEVFELDVSSPSILFSNEIPTHTLRLPPSRQMNPRPGQAATKEDRWPERCRRWFCPSFCPYVPTDRSRRSAGLPGRGDHCLRTFSP